MAGEQDRAAQLSASTWRDVLGGRARDVAPCLLGAVLRYRAPDGEVAVRLTEVEAYGGVGEDPGSHAFRGPGRRNATMFGAPGLLYVYFTYGMHWCSNVVCHPAGAAGAVLLRAGEVVEGLEHARARRPAARRDIDLARGPARLAGALGLDRGHDGVDLFAQGSPLRLEGTVGPPEGQEVARGPRVGVSGPGGEANGFPWRFWLRGEPTVSVYRPGKPRRSRRPAEKGSPSP